MTTYLHRDYRTGDVRELDAGTYEAALKLHKATGTPLAQAWKDAGGEGDVVPTPWGEQEPIGPSFAVELRRAGCGEGVRWTSPNVDHPILTDADGNPMRVPRVNGVVVVDSAWSHNAKLVRDALAAHDPTQPDPLVGASDSEWSIELLDGMTRKATLEPVEQRALISHLQDWNRDRAAKVEQTDAAIVHVTGLQIISLDSMQQAAIDTYRAALDLERAVCATDRTDLRSALKAAPDEAAARTLIARVRARVEVQALSAAAERAEAIKP